MSPCLCPCPHWWWHFLHPLLQEGQLLSATRNALGRGELAGLAPATLSVPLPALGLSLPAFRGHCFRGCHTANPTSSFATTCGCHHRGAISNKMRHSPRRAGEPSAPSAPQGASPQGADTVGYPMGCGERSMLWLCPHSCQTHCSSPDPHPTSSILPAP